MVKVNTVPLKINDAVIGTFHIGLDGRLVTHIPESNVKAYIQKQMDDDNVTDVSISFKYAVDPENIGDIALVKENL